MFTHITKLLTLSLTLTLTILSPFLHPAYGAQTDTNIQELWNQVADAQNKGLPKTAIEYLDQLIPLTLEAKEYGQAVKAIAKKLVFNANIQGNKPEEKIKDILKEIENTPQEIRPMMDLILARWYWDYYQANSWRFADRSATQNTNNDDFTTWDLPQLFKYIDGLYTKILNNADILKQTPITVFENLLDHGTNDSIRPTLYDFAVHEAIQFYTNGAQMIAKPEDAFEITADSDAFAPKEIFVNYVPDTTDTSSPIYKALNLYKDLIKFHTERGDEEALIEADLNRIQFVNAVAFGESKNERYYNRLQEIMEKYPQYDVASMAAYFWAAGLQSQQDFTQAHKIASEGANLRPNSLGVRNCLSIIGEIERKSFNVETEYSMIPGQGEVKINYQNIETLNFRIVEDRWDTFLENTNEWNRPEILQNPSENELQKLISKTPVASWSTSLDPTTDYKTKTKTIPMPELKPGFYKILVSWNNNFSRENNSVSIASFWITNLAVIVREDDGDGFILNSQTGEPIENAQLRIFQLSDNTNSHKQQYFEETEGAVTDKDGYFKIQTKSKNDQSFFYVSYKEDGVFYYNRVFKYNRVDNYHPSASSDDWSTILFTDRSIYRPGQMIQFKALLINSYPKTNTYDFIPDRPLSFVLRDPNGQEVGKINVITNAFGSASGTFTAPTNKLTGAFTITSSIRGSTQIRVEEYKRPKFKVTLNKPENEGKLGEDITLKGNALSYTSAAIDAGKVKFRVVRQVRYPKWWYCWGRQPETPAREITHGNIKTDEQGNFSITFKAYPDVSVPRKDDPTFMYTVYADITDSTGETRSSSMDVNLGYASLQLDAEAKDWIEADQPFDIKVTSSNLNGEPINVSGDISIVNLKQPEKPIKAPLSPQYNYYDQNKTSDTTTDPSNWNTWETDATLQTEKFNTAEGSSTLSFNLKPGVYKAIVTALDKDGEKVTSFLPFVVIDPTTKKFNIKIPNIFKAKSLTVQPGETFSGLWATGYETGRAYVEIGHRGKIVNKYWTDPNVTQQMISWDVSEDFRGGFFVRITQVKENRAYLTSQKIDVPWTNKQLTLSFETFRSKLEPGAKETWTVKIKGPNAETVAAEMVAGLYDASLDAFYPHSWPNLQNIFYADYPTNNPVFGNISVSGKNYFYFDTRGYTVSTQYWQFPHEIISDFSNYVFPFETDRMMLAGFAEESGGSQAMKMASAPMAMKRSAPMKSKDLYSGKGDVDAYFADKVSNDPSQPKIPDLSKVSARTNLNETAFFFPHLTTDENGIVKIEFTMPEALTEWNFLGFAHTQGLMSGSLTGKTVTQKDLMVQPNPPRFLREGDEIEFTTKITNLSDAEQTGQVKLTLTDGQSLEAIDTSFGNTTPEQTFSIPAKRSSTVSWKLKVPDYTGVLIYKVVAATATLSDGEENYLPVLSKRIFVTESLPLPVRGPAEKKFEFKKLLESGQSDTLTQKALTIQMVSNPSWYAIQALPYLMEFPYECSEQIFNRLYANALAQYIANSNPDIRKIFNQWKGTDALKSNLEKNEDLKSIILEETPWVRAAQDETAAKNRVGLLFDENHMVNALQEAAGKLSERQMYSGAWSWFPGGREDFYITLYIMTGYGRLKHMNVETDLTPALKSLNYLDQEIDKIYRNILKEKNEDQEKNHLSNTIAMYLYGRSFFLDQKQIPANTKEAVDYFLGQAKQYWLQLDSRLSQGHLALALNRLGDTETANAIVKSLKERSVSDEEMGMYWRELKLSWWWYRAPIETQSVMIEAFDEIANDEKSVEDMKVWLIKQKQTQDWKTTKATADAIYGLLLKGDDLLASKEIVKVKLGDLDIQPENVEAGTGFYEKKFIGSEVLPSYGNVTVTKTDKGVSWGSLHWQYMEDMSKVTPSATPLVLEKALFVEKDSKAGPVIEPVTGPVKVGDKIKIRITLRVDRDMEYVHMKDYRGSGTEPINVLSTYKYQDGLAYYESTRDTATHFFIDYLPKGTYVFEYPVMIQLKGKYQMGIASIECMYAPEFNSHSASKFIVVE